MKHLVFSIALLLTVLGAAFGLYLGYSEHRMALFRASIPAIPDLSRFPRSFSARVQLATASAGQETGRPAALEELALLYHANGFLPQARQIEEGLARLEPADPRWPYYLADIGLSTGDLPGAMQHLRRVLQLDPTDATAELKLADVLLRDGHPGDAQAHYRRRLELLPADPYAQLGLARIAILEDNWPAAVADLQSLLRGSPDFYTAHNLLAEIYARNGDQAAAADESRRGERSPRFHDAEDPLMAQVQALSYEPYQLQVQGAIQMQAGHLQASLPLYEKAIRLNPRDGTGYDALGDVLMQLGRFDEARAVLAKGITVAPGLYTLPTSLAQILRKQGHPAEAVRVLQAAAGRLPNSAEIRNDLGIALEETGDHAGAAGAYEDAIHLDPAFAEAHLNLGLCLQELGKSASGESHLRRALELKPAGRRTLLTVARSDVEDKRWRTAEHRLELLLALDADDPEARQLLATVHLNLGLAADHRGDVTDAEGEFQAGLAADPDLPELQANAGVLLARQGRMREAAGYFRRFLALQPRDPVAYLYLGQALLADQQRIESRRILSEGIRVAEETGDESAKARLATALELAHR